MPVWERMRDRPPGGGAFRTGTALCGPKGRPGDPGEWRDRGRRSASYRTTRRRVCTSGADCGGGVF